MILSLRSSASSSSMLSLSTRSRAFSTTPSRAVFASNVRSKDDGQVILNRFSRRLTLPKDQGASQAMLYATEGVDSEDDLAKGMVGIANVWYDGNPCNRHVLTLGSRIRESLKKSELIGYGFGVPGVSDGISMGTDGMRFSLQSRDLIADGVETVVGGHWLDGVVGVPACDKNMPGVLMAMGRLNRPSLMVYGGTILPGCTPSSPSTNIDAVSAFQSYGQFLAEGSTDQAESKRKETVRGALNRWDEQKGEWVKGCGACAGMYTANTMSSAAEALGMSLPGSGSSPTVYHSKLAECDQVGPTMKLLLSQNILPKEIMTRKAFENAITLTMFLGGSTNAVLHLIAIAHSVGVDLGIEDFVKVAERTPVCADLKPSGKFHMSDLHNVGGIPAVLKYLYKNGFIDGSTLTVTGKTMAENLETAPELPVGDNEIIRSLSNPIKSTGHIRILKGSLAPGGAVAKITGKEGLSFKGKAMVFDTEDEMVKAVESKKIKKGEKTVVVLRYMGPKGAPGMPEMLKPTSLIIGAELQYDVACLTDGRFSGGTHGFCIGHVVPEAQEGGPIGLVQNGDEISIDAEANSIDVLISPEEMERRRKEWKQPGPRVKQGTLLKYYRNVVDASKGAVTDY